MLAHIVGITSFEILSPQAPLAPPLWPLITTPTSRRCVELVEEEVFTVMGDVGGGDPKRWIFEHRCLQSHDRHQGGLLRSRHRHHRHGEIHRWLRRPDRGIRYHTLCIKNRERRTLTNTYYIPRLTANIVSYDQLHKDGFQINIQSGVTRVHDEKMRLLAKIHHGFGRLYMLDITIAWPVCLVACASKDAWRWHTHFTHISFRAPCKMEREGLVHGLPTLLQFDQVCVACLVDKHQKTPSPHQAQQRATEPLELMHGDICGPITMVTPSGNRYFLLLLDGFSRYMWVVLLPTNDGALMTIKNV
jgi:hypothetical protein